jgi:hypothetical protein
MRVRTCACLLLSIAAWSSWSAPVSAQTAPPTAAAAAAAPSTPRALEGEPASEGQAPERQQSMGGMPEAPGGEYYTSPLKTIGIDMGGGSYAISACVGLFYLVFVYPFQALFGSNRVEPVMLWMLLPIAGPWMAQYEDLVKDKPGWRGVLIADAALQATGLVLGLIGAALSGRISRESESTTGFELQLGVAGSSGLGVTMSLRTL